MSRGLGRIRYAFAMLREAGPLALLGECVRRLAERRTFLLIERILDCPPEPPRLPNGFTFGRATHEDVQSILTDPREESRRTRRLLLMRRYFYESGLTECYVVKHEATGDVCHIRWLVTHEGASRADSGISRRFHSITEDEGRAEYTYTATRWRRQGLAAAAGQGVLGIAFELGLGRVTGVIDRRNLASLATAERQGYRVAGVAVESRFLLARWKRIRATEDRPRPTELARA